MSEIAIQQVRLDPNRRLRLRPVRSSTYPYIYRDASSVRWDDQSAELYVLESSGLDATAEFRQIIAAVGREYGDRLMLPPSTEYVGVPDDVLAAISEFAG